MKIYRLSCKYKNNQRETAFKESLIFTKNKEKAVYIFCKNNNSIMKKDINIEIIRKDIEKEIVIGV